MTMFKGWRTVLANSLFTILPIVQLTEFKDVLPENLLPWYALFIAVINMYLRKITDTKLGKSS